MAENRRRGSTRKRRANKRRANKSRGGASGERANGGGAYEKGESVNVYNNFVLLKKNIEKNILFLESVPLSEYEKHELFKFKDPFKIIKSAEGLLRRDKTENIMSDKVFSTLCFYAYSCLYTLCKVLYKNMPGSDIKEALDKTKEILLILKMRCERIGETVEMPPGE
jgi:hypothetical protein